MAEGLQMTAGSKPSFGHIGPARAVSAACTPGAQHAVSVEGLHGPGSRGAI